jgi:NAD(P)-dependent dehydrogenase (short-subunit alcohol dehydrogenase family)
VLRSPASSRLTARLALVGLEPETMEALATLRRGDVRRECDVSSSKEVTRAVGAAAGALGGLDVVVANAGIAAGEPLRSHDLRSWERVIEINLRRHVHRPGGVAASERSGGYPLNIASTAAAFRGAGMSAYCAAKAGVEALSDCLRIEMQPLGVQVGVAYFLFLDTDMVNDADREMPTLQRAKAENPAGSPARRRADVGEEQVVVVPYVGRYLGRQIRRSVLADGCVEAESLLANDPLHVLGKHGRQVQRDLAERPDDATAIRARDVRGYGSKCQWSH